MNGRGSSRPSCQIGMVDSVTASCTTKSMPRSAIACTTRARCVVVELLRRACLRRWRSAGDRRTPRRSPSCRGRSIISSRTSASPSHQVATFGMIRSAPATAGASAGRKASIARASATPVPSALAMTTLPSRTAWTRPLHAEPRAGVEFQRIGEIGIEPPQQHFGALQAGDGADEDAVVAHRQVLALDQQHAEIARQIGVLEIGLVHRAGREQADRRVVAAVEGRQVGLERLEERRQPLDLERRDRRPGWRARARAGSPARSRRRTAPACGRRAPTSGRRRRGRHRPHRCADARRPAARHRPAAAEIPDCRQSARPEAAVLARASPDRRRRPAPPSSTSARCTRPTLSAFHSSGSISSGTWLSGHGRSAPAGSS